MRNGNSKSGSAGFTLVELVVVIAIIGVLASIAYPAYTSSVKKGQRADAIEAMVALAGRLEEYYLSNDTYDGADVATLMGSTNSSGGYYTMSITNEAGNGVPDRFGYQIRATPVNIDNQCGFLTYTSLGVKGTENNNPDDCW